MQITDITIAMHERSSPRLAVFGTRDGKLPMGVLRIGTDAGIEGTNFLSYPGPGPSQNSSQSSWSGWAPPGQWTAAEPGWVNGPLQPGAATGIALMALYNRNTNPPTYEYQWWVSAITLEQEP